MEKSRNLMVSLTDINARLASIWTGISHIQIDVNTIYSYFDMLSDPHSVSSFASSFDI